MKSKAEHLFYIRLLLSYQKRCTSFQNLHIMANKRCSWKSKYVSLELTKNNNKIDKCLLETSIFMKEKAMRYLFVIILLEC